MKRTLLLTAIALLSISGYSQATFNKAYHTGNETCAPFLVNVHGDLYFASIDAGFGYTSLYKHSTSGFLRFRVPVLNGAVCTYMHKTLDNKLVLVGWLRICDVPQPNQINVITKIDTTGSAVFTTTFQTKSYDDPKVCIQAADSSYLTFTDSLLFIHTKTGQFSSKVTHGLKQVSSALLLQNGNIVVSAMQGSSPVIVTLSPTGTPLSSILSSVLMLNMSFYGGQKIMAIGNDDKLYKLRPQLTLISTCSFSNGTVAPRNFVYSNDSIYTLLQSLSSGVSQYAVLDTSFNMLSLNTTSTSKIYQNGICMSGSRVAILSSCVAGFTINAINYFVSLNVINKMASNNFTSDLILEAVTADSSYVNCNYLVPSSPFCTTNLRPRVQVKNNGTGTITSFKLNCLRGPAICGYTYMQWTFSNVSILPGSSATLNANAFMPYTVGTTSTATTVDLNYCFFTSLPNGEPDKTLEDNDLCKTFTLTITSLKDQGPGLSGIIVAPNPFQNSFVVQSESRINKLEVYNAIGAQVKSHAVNDTIAQIDCNGLPAGVYILKIESDNGIAIKKILKN